MTARKRIDEQLRTIGYQEPQAEAPAPVWVLEPKPVKSGKQTELPGKPVKVPYVARGDMMPVATDERKPVKLQRGKSKETPGQRGSNDIQ